MALTQLQLPAFQARTRQHNGALQIFDTFRRRYVVLTPEEWVRQHLAHFLVNFRGFPSGRLAVEREIRQHGFRRRYDLVAFSADMQPLLLGECKAPGVALSEETLQQIRAYHQSIPAPYLLISNGLQHFCCKLNPTRQSWDFLGDIPHFEAL